MTPKKQRERKIERLLEIVVSTLGIIVEKLDRIETSVTSIQKLEESTALSRQAPKGRFTLRSPLILTLKGLADAKKWVTPEEVSNLTNLALYMVEHRYLPDLYRMGFVVRQFNPNRKKSRSRYLYKINYESIPEDIKAVIYS